LPDYFTAAKKDFGAQWETGDALIPWKNPQGEIQAERYYHGFSIEEVNIISAKAGWNITQCEFGETGFNIVTIAKNNIGNFD
jgi:hypothetical protein